MAAANVEPTAGSAARSLVKKLGGQIGMMVVAWVGMIWFQQDSLIYHPRRYDKPLDTASLSADVELDELRFEASDGQHSALMVRRSGSQAKRIYMVFGGNAMMARDWLGIIPGSLGEQNWSDVAFVLVDYPGFGESAGSASVSSILETASLALTTATDTIDGAFDQEQQTDFVVGAIGHSIGCAAAMHFAVNQQTAHTPLQHLVLSAPFTTLPAMAHEMLSMLKFVPHQAIELLTTRQGWNNLVAADQLVAGQGSDALPRIDIAHGTVDSIVPHKMGVELSQHLRSHGFLVKFVSMEGINHNDIFHAQDYLDWLHSSLAV